MLRIVQEEPVIQIVAIDHGRVTIITLETELKLMEKKEVKARDQICERLVSSAMELRSLEKKMEGEERAECSEVLGIKIVMDDVYRLEKMLGNTGLVVANGREMVNISTNNSKQRVIDWNKRISVSMVDGGSQEVSGLDIAIKLLEPIKVQFPVVTCTDLRFDSRVEQIRIATMENLIGLVNRIQRACTVLGDYGGDSALPTLWESLPSVVVVEGHSLGKSSVVESIVGRDFLPWGSGIVTKRPLVLQLHKINEGTPEYAEFLHHPNKKITYFAKVVVERQPENIVGDIENRVRSYV
ncbi:hypothetical protein SUGI_0862300 [Cryptomeria japonica]|nr:hypothetical protein SUGI_0862300 [Cryptomeria japonica]